MARRLRQKTNAIRRAEVVQAGSPEADGSMYNMLLFKLLYISKNANILSRHRTTSGLAGQAWNHGRAFYAKPDRLGSRTC